MTNRIEAIKYRRSPYASQKWYAGLFNEIGLVVARCGHSHSSEALAVKCAEEWAKETGQ